jgi:methylamine---glutamate N-methyltransferase subunit A
MLHAMVQTLCVRGPDSAGFALYGDASAGLQKLTLRVPPGHDVARDISRMQADLDLSASRVQRSTHVVLSVPHARVSSVRQWLESNAPEVSIVGEGRKMEIYKEVGSPSSVVDQFELASMRGSHAIAHTRMATESAVTTDGAHPFSTGPDQCLVHNGSLSNHASLRRELRQHGVTIRTENDTEVAAGYVTRALRDGRSLRDALEGSLSDLDGFYTFVVGTESGFGVLRDPISCKPAVMAETDSYVAFGSEYRTLTSLPGIESARIWEPSPATVYFWERQA